MLPLLLACTSTPLPQDAYVWQRAWTPAVQQAVSQHGTAFDRLLLLAAENTLNPPSLVEIEPDPATLGDRPVVAVLRIGPWPGPFDDDLGLPALAARTVERLQGAGLRVVALQLDFDAASSQLGGYTRWIQAIQSTVNVPVEITALPDWLHRPELPALLAATDGYTLQLHDFSAPSSPDGIPPLLVVEQARADIEAAAALGRPFSVALPTYGYTAAFTPDGRYLGATAERDQPWSGAVITREIEADPAALAELVSDLDRQRPAELTRIAWFRLPTEADTHAWRWPTLDAVRHGRAPTAALSARAEAAGDGLVTLSVENQGEAGGVLRDVRVTGGREALAAEGLGGWTAARDRAGLRWIAPPQTRLPPGETRVIGWLRLPSHQIVQAEIIEN